MAPEKLSLLLDSLIGKGYDYTKGNRFLHSEAINQMQVVRITGNIILTFLTKAASGYRHIFDPQNGYTTIRAEALRSIALEKLDRRFFFENDMLVRLNIHNFRVTDVAMAARYGQETSDLRISKILITLFGSRSTMVANAVLREFRFGASNNCSRLFRLSIQSSRC
jgi:dolichol-phosphate mannosyltransferase